MVNSLSRITSYTVLRVNVVSFAHNSRAVLVEVQAAVFDPAPKYLKLLPSESILTAAEEAGAARTRALIVDVFSVADSLL